MKSGKGRLTSGALLLLFGGVLLVGTVRNPTFDPALGLRASVDEGTAAVELSGPGDYVVFLESSDCTGGTTELARVGERTVSLSPLTDARFAPYTFDDRCAQPLGVASIPVAGLWTASLTTVEGANLVLYEAAAPPTSADWDLSWLFLPALGAGVVLVGQGLVQHSQWRRSQRALMS